jgi:ribonucleoside-diphosphate reductase alpha chain
MSGPQTVWADQLHAMKYRGEGEDFREAMNRIASALKDSDEHYHEFRDILLEQRFVPAGRIQAAMGSSRAVTAFNCAVSDTIADSYVDGPGNIMQRATEAAATMRMGCGVGYDFSTLRPRGETIRGLGSQASGPVSFMHIFDAICLATASSGHRRGAQMGVLRVDHPSIEEFIRAKQNTSALTGFNLSVAVTDEFMAAVKEGHPFTLRFGSRNYDTIDARALWEAIMRSTWDYGEPGVIFIDRVNAMNNLWYCETIAASNPCAEQVLPPGGMCLLGSFNLVKYLTMASPGRWRFNYHQLRCDIPHVVRAMDNVTDRSRYPLYAQKAEALTKRRMGLGVMGLANALEAMGYPYASSQFLVEERIILGAIRNGAYGASVALAAEKGPFPLFDKDKYLEGAFIRALPDNIRIGISTYGIRNSHLTSIAPTGTISQTCDNVSSGIEPVWSYETRRAINTPSGQTYVEARDYGASYLGIRGRLAREVSPREHIDVLAAAQPFIDSAISKTVNVPHTLPWQEFKDVYMYAYKSGAKSCATFTDGGVRGGLLADADAVGGACFVDPMTGERGCE